MISQFIQILRDQKRQILVILGFLTLSTGLFFPVIQGKGLYQSDIAQYKGMAQRRDQARSNGVEAYWTQSAFGGMPTYQLGAHYGYHMIRAIDRGIRFLPRPIDYVFLYLVAAYAFFLVLGIDYRASALGALGFALATYHLIIIDVGHNAKAHAIGYFPLVLASAYGLFRNKRILIWTLALALFVGLEIYANHYQMTYYLFMFLGILWLAEAIRTAREQALVPFFKRTGLLVIAVVWGIALNATSILATKEYSEFSTRGTSSITTAPDGTPKSHTSGLSLDYITQYSYGIKESLNLFLPRFVGGSNTESLGEDSEIYRFLRDNNVPRSSALQFANNAPLYWGDQPIVAAPAYLGAVTLVLACLGFFYLDRTSKVAIGFSFVFFLALSWGKNFMPLTEWMVNIMPLYDKFRAVSSIQVILSLIAPALAAYGAFKFFHTPKEQALKTVTLVVSLLFAAALALGMGSDFSGPSDAYYAQNYSQEFVDALIADRTQTFYADIARSFLLSALSLGLLWYVRFKGTNKGYYIGFVLLIIVDLGGIAKRYIQPSDFVSARNIEQPFKASAIDLELQKDSTYFKVFNLNEGLNGARTSYFHRSLGGYHAAKPAFIQNITEYLIYRDRPEVLDMLNVKYLITTDQSGEEALMPYTSTLGPAWLVDSLVLASNEEEALLGLNTLDFKRQALVQKEQYHGPLAFASNAEDAIEVVSAKEGEIHYQYTIASDRYAVFSEWFYTPNPSDWKLEVDGSLVPLYQTNYGLIGARLKAGSHQARLYFDPQVVATGDRWRLPAQLLFLFAFILIPLYEWKRP
jgi:hypothetical protein